MDPTRQDAELQVSSTEEGCCHYCVGSWVPTAGRLLPRLDQLRIFPLVLVMNLSQCLQAEGGHGPGRGRVLYVANEAALYTALTITTNTRVLAVCKQTE